MLGADFLIGKSIIYASTFNPSWRAGAADGPPSHSAACAGRKIAILHDVRACAIRDCHECPE
jgi:hypothetical protein